MKILIYRVYARNKYDSCQGSSSLIYSTLSRTDAQKYVKVYIEKNIKHNPYNVWKEEKNW
jgi:hypothetical protein